MCNDVSLPSSMLRLLSMVPIALCMEWRKPLGLRLLLLLSVRPMMTATTTTTSTPAVTVISSSSSS